MRSSSACSCPGRLARDLVLFISWLSNFDLNPTTGVGFGFASLAQSPLIIGGSLMVVAVLSRFAARRRCGRVAGRLVTDRWERRFWPLVGVIVALAAVLRVTYVLPTIGSSSGARFDYHLGGAPPGRRSRVHLHLR